MPYFTTDMWEMVLWNLSFIPEHINHVFYSHPRPIHRDPRPMHRDPRPIHRDPRPIHRPYYQHW